MRIVTRSLLPIGTSELFRSWKRFRPALRGQRWRIANALLLALAIAAFELARPWPIKWVIDYIVLEAPDLDDGLAVALRPVIPWVLISVAIPIALGVATMLMTVEIAKIGRKASVRIRRDLFDHMQRLELSEHQTRYSGDLLVRLMGDVNMVRDLLFASWITIISRGAILVGTAIVFSLLDWWLFMIAILPLPWVWFGVANTAKKVKTAAGKQRRKEGAIASYASEMLGQVSLVKAFSAEDRASQRFQAEARSAERATLAATRHSAAMARLTEIIIGIGVALVLMFGTIYAIVGLITPGELLVALSYARLIYKPIRKLTAEGARLAKASACAGRVVDILDLPVESADEGEPVGPLRGEIAFEDVSHTYADGRPSLRGVSGVVPAGSLVAITGENGSGKSTLLGLVLRLHTPDSGRITIDGRDIASLALSQYRRQIAYVPQGLALFGGSIRDNIAYGKPDATNEEIERAAEAALFAPVVNALPDGYDTILDEDGASLSGGQARRLMIARAAVRDASILLLDEPLAGLDPEARDLVAQAITSISAGRTTLVVHHGSVVELDPDLVVELDRGTIAKATARPAKSRQKDRGDDGEDEPWLQVVVS